MKKTKLSIEDYTKLMTNFMAAWSKADIELTASFYADKLEYRDPSVPQGIFDKEAFKEYLKAVFKIWPRQKWVATSMIPHTTSGAFSIEYEFEFGNDKTTIKGRGIDRAELKGDKIILNHVYLNAEKWNKWITNELKGV